jgi:hypothetical protein
MTQYMRPISDINTGWTPDPPTAGKRYVCIDEEVPDDSDSILAIANYYQECKLSAPADTPSSGECVLKFRASRDLSGTITPSIRQGATIIKTGSAVSPSSFPTFTQYTLTLSAAEMANITDWSDVRVRFAASTSGWCGVYVSWAVLEVPDKKSSASVGLEMGCNF